MSPLWFTHTRRRLSFVQFRRNPLLNLTLEKSHSFPHSKKIFDKHNKKKSRHTQLFCKRNWADEIFPAESLFFVRLAHANISKMYNLIHNRRKAIVLFIIVTSLINAEIFIAKNFTNFSAICFILLWLLLFIKFNENETRVMDVVTIMLNTTMKKNWMCNYMINKFINHTRPPRLFYCWSTRK